MRYLLDVNVLVAWGWSDHSEHDRVVRWIGKAKRQHHMLLTSAIPELGFVRVSGQRTGGRVTPAEAGAVLADMLHSLGKAHLFIPDDFQSMEWPDWCTNAARTTDAHLVQLAKSHAAELATLDLGIPSAFAIP